MYNVLFILRACPRGSRRWRSRGRGRCRGCSGGDDGCSAATCCSPRRLACRPRLRHSCCRYCRGCRVASPSSTLATMACNSPLFEYLVPAERKRGIRAFLCRYSKGFSRLLAWQREEKSIHFRNALIFGVLFSCDIIIIIIIILNVCLRFFFIINWCEFGIYINCWSNGCNFDKFATFIEVAVYIRDT